jgi:hypothetical protein
MTTIDLATVTPEHFEPLRGQGFELHAPSGALALTLAEISRVGQAIRQGGAFTLLFVAQDTRRLPQAIYPVSHPQLGRLDIFLVPIGPVPGGGTGYEAVFT